MAEQLAQNYVMTGGTTMATPSANVQKDKWTEMLFFDW